MYWMKDEPGGFRGRVGKFLGWDGDQAGAKEEEWHMQARPAQKGVAV